MHPSDEVREKLLDVDGPVLLELREAIADELSEGWFSQEGDEIHHDDPAVDSLGAAVTERVQAKLQAALPALRAQFREELLGEAAVERAARSIWNCDVVDEGDVAWEDAEDWAKAQYRTVAKDNLEAALSALASPDQEGS